MNTQDVKKFSDIIYMLGQIEGFCDADWVTNHCDVIHEYIKELFIDNNFAKISGCEERREP